MSCLSSDILSTGITEIGYLLTVKPALSLELNFPLHFHIVFTTSSSNRVCRSTGTWLPLVLVTPMPTAPKSASVRSRRPSATRKMDPTLQLPHQPKAVPRRIPPPAPVPTQLHPRSPSLVLPESPKLPRLKSWLR